MKQSYTTYRELLANELKEDPEFKEEYIKLKAQKNILHIIKTARKQAKLTQKQLAEKTGIKQDEISRIERGLRNPTLDTLYKLAIGTGNTLKIDFIPA